VQGGALGAQPCSIDCSGPACGFGHHHVADRPFACPRSVTPAPMNGSTVPIIAGPDGLAGASCGKAKGPEISGVFQAHEHHLTPARAGQT